MKALALFTVFSSLSIASSLAYAGDDVTLDQLPAAVRATVQREVGGGQISEIEKDVKRGKTVYEVEYFAEQKKWELEIAEDGTLLDRKED